MDLASSLNWTRTFQDVYGPLLGLSSIIPYSTLTHRKAILDYARIQPTIYTSASDLDATESLASSVNSSP